MSIQPIKNINAYLAVTRIAIEFDEIDPRISEILRDALDLMWWNLTDQERSTIENLSCMGD